MLRETKTSGKSFSVFVTRPILSVGLDILSQYTHVRVRRGHRAITRKELYAGAAKADALLCLLTDRIDRAFLEKNRHLRVIANYAVGVDNIDLEAATALGIPVVNTPGVLNEAVAEHALSLICSVARRIPEADRFVRDGKYQGWEPMLFLGTDFFDAHLGIVGLGRIGESLARRASQGLGMKILYTDMRPNPEFERKYHAHYVSLHALLKQSDFVSVHVPLVPSTRHLIGAKEFRLMKKTAYLINTSRGPVLDEKALVFALRRKQIAGAALDVFENEPRLAPGLTKLSNVILTPHIASATISARNEMSLLAARGILHVLRHTRPENLANPLVWRRFLMRH